MINQAIITNFIALMGSSSKLEEDDLIHNVIRFVRDEFQIFNVAVRVKEGDIFAYYASLGYSNKFMRIDHFDFCKEDDPSNECMCWNVMNKHEICENKKCLSPRGSFWSNNIPECIKEIGYEKFTRGACIKSGYKSTATIPIAYNNHNIGLLLLNDSQPNKFTIDTIETVEEIATIIGERLGGSHYKILTAIEKKKLIKSYIKVKLKELQTVSKTILENRNDNIV